jgi:hypothetical protein
MSTNVSEEHIASIFTAKEYAEQETSVKAGGKQLVSCLAYSLDLKMEAICSSETSADIQRTIWHYIPEEYSS